MKKILYLTLFLTITGCTIPQSVNQFIINGNYGEAYSTILSKNQDSDKAAVVKEIKNETGGAKGRKFFESLRNNFRSTNLENTNTPKDLIFIWQSAESDELISKQQHENLKEELVNYLIEISIQNPQRLNSEIIKNFMISEGVSPDPTKHAEDLLKKLRESGDTDANKYLSLYKAFQNYAPFNEKIKDNVRDVIIKNLQLDSESNSFTNLYPSFEYIELTNDKSLNDIFIKKLRSIKLTRKI